MKKRTLKNTFNKIENRELRRLVAWTSANNWRYWHIKHKLSVSRNLRGRRNIACPRKRREAEARTGRFPSVCIMQLSPQSKAQSKVLLGQMTVVQVVRISSPVTEPNGSLPCSQELSTGLHFQPFEFRNPICTLTSYPFTNRFNFYVFYKNVI